MLLTLRKVIVVQDPRGLFYQYSSLSLDAKPWMLLSNCQLHISLLLFSMAHKLHVISYVQQSLVFGLSIYLIFSFWNLAVGVVLSILIELKVALKEQPVLWLYIALTSSAFKS